MKTTSNHLARFTAGVLLTMHVAAPSVAQEWTRFRGPNGSGISGASGLPTAFTESDYNWRVALTGAGASSPVLWGRRIFVTGADEERGRTVICLDAGSGKPLWSRNYPFTRHAKHRFNGFASSTPAVDADRVYLLWTEPERLSVVAAAPVAEDAPVACRLGVNVAALYDLDPAKGSFGADLWLWSLCPTQGLSPLALAALDILDQDAETYALDAVSLIEAILEGPRPVLSAQRFKARGEAVQAMKADGIEYEDRMALLEDVDYPKPLADLIEVAYEAYQKGAPWIA